MYDYYASSRAVSIQQTLQSRDWNRAKEHKQISLYVIFAVGIRHDSMGWYRMRFIALTTLDSATIHRRMTKFNEWNAY